MPEFPAFTPSPARVHERARELTGHNPCWIRPPYAGGLVSIAHFRSCSYCRSIHPSDLIELLQAGASRLMKAKKPDKFILITPNPIAGELVHMGTVPGPIFPKRRQPADLVSRLMIAWREDLNFEPSIGERLVGHFERRALEPAPKTISWPFFMDHTTERQWAEIEAAATHQHKGEEEHAVPGT